MTKGRKQAGIGVELVSLIPGCGYGDAAVQYAAALDNYGVNVSWRPVSSNTNRLLTKARALADAGLPAMERLWNRTLETSALLLQVPPYHWHHHWAESAKNRELFTYVAWEVDQLPQEWPAALNRYQKVLVPSEFNREVFKQGGVTVPVEVVPHIARPLTPSGEQVPLGSVGEQDYVFYTIASWISRKAMEQTIRAYLNAFSFRDPVALVIKSEYFDQFALNCVDRSPDAPDYMLTSAWSLARILSEYPDPARIHLIPHRLEPGQIDQLHQRGDCFISLTHSEGWGLGAFEAALAGNPVVITGWGGQLDYLGKDYPWLVNYQLTPTDQTPDDGYFRHASDVHWATASTSNASELMLDAWQRADQVREFTEEFGSKLQTRFAASTIARQLALSMNLEPSQKL